MSYKRILLGAIAVVFCAGAGVCFGGPVIEVEPTELNFSALEWGSNPDVQVLYISNSGPGKLEWEITEDCEWLSATPKKGNCVDEIDEVEVSVNISTLSAGEYSSELIITDPDASNSPQMVAVKLTVIGPIMEVSPLEFQFTGLEGGDNPPDKVLTISNNGGGVLEWEIVSDCSWLSVDIDNGSLATGETDEVQLSVDMTDLSLGEYSCELTITDPDAVNSPQVITVNLLVRQIGEGLWVPYEYETIQAAIDDANDGDIVIVADGIYTGDGNRDIDFNGKAITVRSENGPVNCIIDSQGSESDWHYGFDFESGEGPDSVLDGFTIKNGYCSIGGGIGIASSSPTVRNCIFIDNMSPWRGGAINMGGSSAKIDNCTFINNIAYSELWIWPDEVDYFGMGGGIYCGEGSMEITNCAFIENSAVEGGGGIYCYYYSNSTITDCEFEGNSYNGLYGCNGTISNCVISNNTGSGLYGCDGLISKCVISNNTGGGLRGCNGLISDSIISNNGSGFSGCDGTISNCIISNNGRGFYDCSSMIINCTISGNTEGGGIYVRYEAPIVTNTILWENLPQEIYLYSSTTPTVTYCDIKGGWEGEGNINVDPKFVDKINGDYHLQWDSPCIDTGDPYYMPYVAEPNVFDIDGEPRVMGGRVDMGADEVGEKQADFTRDGRIDISDLAVLSRAWDTMEGEGNWYVLSDLFEDGVIGLDDLAIFVDDWMWVAGWAD